ncbi:MAG: hypothetical protein BGO12_14040 [Verrucomicrobia bacterium 61-8]|nr:DNA gyrase inhibitor YacG [Verrucomicrobiota bacterium]OJU99407.1 MAG: hypothetical protein BGO12_14040 [Verrucomicrobia bacterium 61-8]
MSKENTCPTCGKKGPWFNQPYAPFCSERCKLVDLGRWLGEEYRIASPITAEDLEELADFDENELKRTDDEP